MLCLLKFRNAGTLKAPDEDWISPLELENLPDSRPEVDPTHLHGECTVIPLNKKGDGVACELPSKKQRKKFLNGFPTCSVAKMEKSTSALVTCSRLIRKMRDTSVQMAVNKPANTAEATDADIILSSVTYQLTMARWAKANKVLTVNRVLQKFKGFAHGTTSSPEPSTGNLTPEPSTGRLCLPSSTNNLFPETSTGSLIKPSSTKNLIPEPSTGNLSPQSSTSNLGPQPRTGNLTSQRGTGNLTPEPSTGNLSLPSSTHNLSPETSTGSLIIPSSTVNLIPEPSTSNLSPQPSSGNLGPQPSTGNLIPESSTGNLSNTTDLSSEPSTGNLGPQRRTVNLTLQPHRARRRKSLPPIFTPKSQERRKSVTEIALHDSKPLSTKVPKAMDYLPLKYCKEICTGLTGAFAFAYVDALRKYVLAARSADGIVPLYWYHDSTHGLAFTSELEILPEETVCDEYKELVNYGTVPPGHFFIGTAADHPDQNFHPFAHFDNTLKPILLEGNEVLMDRESLKRLSGEIDPV